MTEEVKGFTNHLLREMERVHGNNDRILEKLSEQNEVLVRNTVSLEEHVRRTNMLEEKMEHVETEVSEIKAHITKVNTVLDILKPTKEKLKIIAILSTLLGGSYGGYQLSLKDNLSKTIQTIEKVIK